jgi:hypothetical protein
MESHPLKFFAGFSNFFSSQKGGFDGGTHEQRTLCLRVLFIRGLHARFDLEERRRRGPHMSYIEHAPPWAEIDPDLEKLFHPASAFNHPQDVVRDPDLTTEEKRAILSSWASDACAVESQPAARLPPGAKQPVGFDEIVDALRSLSRSPNGSVWYDCTDPAVGTNKTAVSS